MLYAFNLRAFFGEILRCMFGARHRTKARVRVRVTGRGRGRARIEKTRNPGSSRPRGVFHKKVLNACTFYGFVSPKFVRSPKLFHRNAPRGIKRMLQVRK